MLKVKTAEELKGHIGDHLGSSQWVKIEQDRVNAFADCTGDYQFIHVDEALAKPIFGGTIAHGFLTLSMIIPMMESVMPIIENSKMAINYGLNKVRFLQPVLVGSHINADVTLLDVTDKGHGRFLLTVSVTVNIKGQEKPAYIAEHLSLITSEVK